MSLLSELGKRHAPRIVLAYAMACWLLIQAIDAAEPFFAISESLRQALIFLLVIGAIPTVILTSTSNEPMSSKRLNQAIVLLLGMGAALWLADRNSPPVPVASTLAGYDARGGTFEARSDSDSDLSAPRAESRSSLVVLPLEILSTGPDDDYFTDGLTEELINVLSLTPGLRVTGRESAFRFRGQPAMDSARNLGAMHVLKGTLSRAGNQLSIAVQLQRTDDGKTLWSENYRERTNEVFSIQSEIVRQTILTLGIMISESQLEQITRAGVRNSEAITEFQKGVGLRSRARAAANPFSLLREANIFFQFAVDLHPGYYSAHLGQAELFLRLLMTDANGQVDAYLSQQDLDSAPIKLFRTLDNSAISAWTMAQAQFARFDSTLVQGDWRGLASRISDNIGLAGCAPPRWLYLAGSPFGYADPVSDTYRAALVCDPMVSSYAAHFAMAAVWQDDAAEAAFIASSYLERRASLHVAHVAALALAASDLKAEALTVVDERLTDERSRSFALGLLAAQTGQYDEAGRFLEEFLGRHGPDDYHALMIEAARGNRQQANLLAGRIDSRELGHIALLNAIYYCACGAPFDLDSTPRFSSRLQESGLSWPPTSPINWPLKDW